MSREGETERGGWREREREMDYFSYTVNHNTLIKTILCEKSKVGM